MITASDALSSIEQAARSVRSDEDRMAAVMKSASEEMARLRADQFAQFRSLAKIRLDALAHKQIVGDLNDAERQALAALDEVMNRLKDIDGERSSLDKTLAAAQAEREQKAKAVAAAKDAASLREIETQKRLSGDVDWQALSAGATGAVSRAVAAEEKAVQSEKDRDEKSKPYLADRLFTYLWERGYGTLAYRGGNLARMGDAFVARVVGYEEARQNYFMLTEIPKRLREHADRLKVEVGDAQAKLAAFERKALEADGIEKLEQAEKAAIDALDAAARKVADIEKSRAALDAERAALLDGSDGRGIQQVIDTLAASMAREDLRKLLRDALQTPSPEDERIVASLQKIDDNIGRLQKQAEEARRTMIDLAKKRTELERAQDDFMRVGYDRRGGDFINEQLIGSILGGIIGGAMSSRDLNDALRSGYRERRRPSSPINIDFGGRGGGFGGGFGGGGGSGGGGGFRTGGGF